MEYVVFLRGVAAALSVVASGVLVHAGGLQRSLLVNPPAGMHGLHRVGHEPMAPDPTIRRYTGKVLSVAPADGHGMVFTFRSVPIGPRSFTPKPDELRAWRMTVLSGKSFGKEFRVGSNTESEITVSAEHGSLEGLAPNDVFVVESIDPNGASMFAAPPAPAPGNT